MQLYKQQLLSSARLLTFSIIQVTYSSVLRAGLLGNDWVWLLLWLLLPLLHLLCFFLLNLQQGLSNDWLLGHMAPTRQLSLGQLSLLQGLLLLQLQELLLLTSLLWGR